MRRLLKNDELFDAIANDWRTAELGDKRKAMLEYSVKLTVSPGAMAESDVVALRDVGFSDRDILDICEVVSYYAYVNRVADGLGVQLETWLET
ncbi:MAG: peroxidase [Acidimicrobiia bacterium]|nr:peroxidase [Acidimicrobiia bacterium]